jgi:sugar/nucleoside kinase (ribokinase family)
MESPRHARILVIGHSCLDSIAISATTPPDDGKTEASRIWIGPGGPATNAAIALARLGHDVGLATSFGDDPAGKLIAAHLHREGVRLLVEAFEGETSSLAQIRAAGESRSVLWRRGALRQIEPDPVRIAAWLAACDLLYVDGHEVPAATVALGIAQAAGIRCVADLGSLRDGSEEWPSMLSSAVATPRWLARRFSTHPSLGDAMEALSEVSCNGAMVGVSLGSRGGFARIGGDQLAWTARKTGVVDSTGAGDAFHAGLADALVQGMAPQETLDWSATLAAAICRAPGHSALPADRKQLALWHGRWGYRTAPTPDILTSPLGSS